MAVHRLLRLGAFCACWFVLWLLLVEKSSVGELTVGVATSLVTGLASELVWGEQLTRFTARPRLLAQAWRLPALFAIGTYEIFKVLARQLFTGRKANSLLRCFSVKGTSSRR